MYLGHRDVVDHSEVLLVLLCIALRSPGGDSMQTGHSLDGVCWRVLLCCSAIATGRTTNCAPDE